MTSEQAYGPVAVKAAAADSSACRSSAWQLTEQKLQQALPGYRTNLQQAEQRLQQKRNELGQERRKILAGP